MDEVPTILEIINFGGLVFAIYQLIRQRKDMEHLARISNSLEGELHHLSVELDQNIQRLHRARDLVNNYHKAMLTLDTWKVFNKSDELSDREQIVFVEAIASMVELKGIAQALGDAKLIELSSRQPPSHKIETGADLLSSSGNVAITAAQLHTQIYKLLAEATKSKNR